MAITINGSGTITGVSAGGLPDNCITADDLATTLDLSNNTITLPSGTGGKVLQVVTTKDNTQFSTTSTSYQDTGLGVSITPSSTSNKIMLVASVSLYGGGANTHAIASIYRGSIASGTHLGTTFGLAQTFTNSGEVIATCSIVYLDSPSTTSATDYTVALRSNTGGTVYYNVNSEYSNIIAMEIAG